MAYLNVVEVESALAALAAHYPSITERIKLPNKTVEGRTCTALRIGASAAQARDALLITGAVHAREWGGSDIAVGFAADLLEAYTTHRDLRYGKLRVRASSVRRIVETMQIIVFPQVNPDGKYYSQTRDAMWRRNRNPDSSHGHARCIGVDLNRNHDFLWEFEKYFDPDASVGTSADPCSREQTWRGPAANSEAETKNIHYLLKVFPRTRWYIDIHSYGPMVLYPWGNDENQTTDPNQTFTNPAFDGDRGMGGDTGYREYLPAADLAEHQRLASAMASGIKGVRGKVYEAKQAFDLYPTSGAGDDYAYSRHFVDPKLKKIYAFTLEFGDSSFAPDWDEMEDIVADISGGLMRFCTATRRGVRG